VSLSWCCVGPKDGGWSMEGVVEWVVTKRIAYAWVVGGKLITNRESSVVDFCGARRRNISGEGTGEGGAGGRTEQAPPPRVLLLALI